MRSCVAGCKLRWVQTEASSRICSFDIIAQLAADCSLAPETHIAASKHVFDRQLIAAFAPRLVLYLECTDLLAGPTAGQSADLKMGNDDHSS